MDVYDLNNLKRENGTGDYDLTQLTFRSRNDIVLFQYEVQRGEEMRIDLVSESIYGTNEYIDIIMHINNIDNPLNIKEGVILRYPSSTDIGQYRITEEKPTQVQTKIVNTNKTNRKDSNREIFVKQGYTLPPVVLDQPVNPVKIEGDNIVIGGNSF